jgi:CheY-like chemotaxis protein
MKRILIVEDNEVTRLLLKESLNNRFEIDEAADGSIAITLILENEYDLILTDIIMPNMKGTTLARIIYQVQPKLPFIIISSITGDYKTFQKEFPNVKVWIQKPFKPLLMAGMVDGVFGGHLD